MSKNLQEILVGLAIIVASQTIFLAVRGLAFKMLGKWCERNRNELNQLIYRVTRIPSFFWCLGISILLAIRFSALPEKYTSPLHTMVEVLLMLSITIAISGLIESLVVQQLQKAGSAMAGSGLVKGVIRSSVYTMGILMILSQLGIQIGPLLTALGVGGLAVALAFKDTVENMFSGIHLLFDKSVEVGDLIKIESGQEGIVKDIGWRTSKIRLSDDETLIIPNCKLAQNITIRKKKNANYGSNERATLYRQMAK
jgi:small-conductance mechanosensitive channel